MEETKEELFKERYGKENPTIEEMNDVDIAELNECVEETQRYMEKMEAELAEAKEEALANPESYASSLVKVIEEIQIPTCKNVLKIYNDAIQELENQNE
jgi:uncharacterized coiled-coil protein SlyX